MAETKRTIRVFGHDVSVSEVPIIDAEERFIQYKLEDGTILKVKNVATAALRVENEYLLDGSPVYLVLSNPVVGVVSSPHKKNQKQEKTN